jgi:hypothetical protein
MERIMRKKGVSKEKTFNRNRGGAGKSRPLRGERLVKAAETELTAMAKLSPKTNPINMSSLARRLNVTRKPLYDNGLKKAVDEYAKLQRQHSEGEVKTVRRSESERIAALENLLAEKDRLLDGWIERWVVFEYNAKMYGIDADKLFEPMPPPQRRTLIFKGNSSKRGHVR